MTSLCAMLDARGSFGFRVSLPGDDREHVDDGRTIVCCSANYSCCWKAVKISS